jgi:hypothetical protein
VIQGEAVLVAGHDEQEEKEGEAWNHVFVKRVQRLLEKVAEGDDNKHNAESQEGVIHAPAGEKEGSSDELDKRNGKTDSPEGPGRQECVLIREEPLAHVSNRSQGEDLEYSGHEEDESQDESREENCPGAGSGGRRVHRGECSRESARPVNPTALPVVGQFERKVPSHLGAEAENRPGSVVVPFVGTRRPAVMGRTGRR